MSSKKKDIKKAEEPEVKPKGIIPEGLTEKKESKTCAKCHFFNQTTPTEGMCNVGYPKKHGANDYCGSFNPESRRRRWVYGA